MLIELAKETNDIERLNLLKEKLHKAASTVLLYTEELMLATDQAIAKVTTNSSESLDTQQQHDHVSITEREGDGGGEEEDEGGDHNNTTSNSSTSLNFTPDVIIL